MRKIKKNVNFIDAIYKHFNQIMCKFIVVFYIEIIHFNRKFVSKIT